MAACFALGVIGDNRSVEHLIKSLEIRNVGMRKAGCSALEKLSEERLTKGIWELYQVMKR